ncbi:MAG: hypothetical protein AVDCRST_MAG77-4012 [uncultured Chloroflexi bacterium]|uniref:Uncharacterized protein n=1 Tax=uncultured Chloroflexota bacterium TaxID=166587 RepID=A0A6J4JN55_9CHLR|nr:MAG: hypothetical protein AVDCRST_MAG77-4012 [uncultured Chloroflexota bacterium]
MIWWITPSTRPEGLRHYLVAQGMAQLGAVRGMAAALAAVSGESVAVPVALTVSEVQNEAAMREWGDTFTSAYTLPKMVADHLLQASALGRPLYERLGFRECCVLAVFGWQVERQALA